MYRVFALIGILWFTGAVTLLHLLKPTCSPATCTVSEYTLGQYGWLMTTAFGALALGSASLAYWLRTCRALGTATLVLLGIWAVGTAVAGTFPTDPGGAATSWHSIIHGIGASVALFSLYLAEISYEVGYLRSHTHKTAPRELAIITGGVCCVILFIVVLGVVGSLPFGFLERGVIAAHLVWLLSLVAWAAPAHD